MTMQVYDVLDDDTDQPIYADEFADYPEDDGWMERYGSMVVAGGGCGYPTRGGQGRAARDTARAGSTAALCWLLACLTPLAAFVSIWLLVGPLAWLVVCAAAQRAMDGKRGGA